MESCSINTNQNIQMTLFYGGVWLIITFHINKIAKESQRFHLEKVCDVLQRDLEWIPLVQLKMGVDGETKICLHGAAERLHKMLQGDQKRNMCN